MSEVSCRGDELHVSFHLLLLVKHLDRGVEERVEVLEENS